MLGTAVLVLSCAFPLAEFSDPHCSGRRKFSLRSLLSVGAQELVSCALAAVRESRSRSILIGSACSFSNVTV